MLCNFIYDNQQIKSSSMYSTYNTDKNIVNNLLTQKCDVIDFSEDKKSTIFSQMFNMIIYFNIILITIILFYLKLIFHDQKINDSNNVNIEEIEPTSLFISILCAMLTIIINLFLLEYDYYWIVANTILYFIFLPILCWFFKIFEEDNVIHITEIDYKQIIIFILLLGLFLFFRYLYVIIDLLY